MDFYCILQEILNEKGLTVAEAARICNVSDSTIRSIITRKNKTVALEVAMKISNSLGVSLERLNGMEEKGEKDKGKSSNALHPVEKKLLSDFRSLNDTGKAFILQSIKVAVNSYKEAPEKVKRKEAPCRRENNSY